MSLITTSNNEILYMTERITKKGNLKLKRSKTLLMPMPASFDVTDKDDQDDFVSSLLKVDIQDLEGLHNWISVAVNPDENAIGVVVFRPKEVEHRQKLRLKRWHNYAKHIQKANTVSDLFPENRDD